MHVKPSDFGLTPRAVLDTLKLISISRREVLNIVNVVDCDAPGNATALDRNSFAGMKNALMVYEVFLCGAGFPFAQNDKVNAAYAELNQAWSKLVQTVCRHCTDKKVAKRLSVAWSAAIEELCAILERAKAKTSASKLLYDAFALALDEASDALSKRRRSARTVMCLGILSYDGKGNRQKTVQATLLIHGATTNRYEPTWNCETPSRCFLIRLKLILTQKTKPRSKVNDSE